MIAVAITFEPVQIGGVIGGIMKHCGPLIATDNDMKERAGKVDAGLAGHAGESMSQSDISQYSGLTPFLRPSRLHKSRRAEQPII